jgi:hypothetical protein
LVEKDFRFSNFLKFSVTEDGDPVAVEDRLQPVGHRQDGAIGELLLDRRLNQLIKKVYVFSRFK